MNDSSLNMDAHNSQAEELFSAAWEQVAAGHSIASVLAEHPEAEVTLGPMLKLMQQVHDMPQPSLSLDALARIEKQTLTQVASHWKPVLTPARPETSTMPFAARLRADLGALSLVAALLVAVVGAILLLQAGQPGLPERPKLESYRGTITTLMPGRWQVGDTEVVLDSETKVHGQPAVGAKMICIMQPLSGDRIYALEIWVGVEPATPLTVPTHPP